MFNFIASALMTHLLVNVLIKPGQQSPETREFDPNTWLPQLHDVARSLGWEIGRSPLNLSVLVALAAGAGVWIYLWHTRWGYELRRSEEHTSELQSRSDLVCRLLLEKK